MTEKQTHTPGPWKDLCSFYGQANKMRVWSGDKLIADCGVVCDRFGNDTNAEANAALIAAAPDLLAAARAALAYLDEYRPKGGVAKNFEHYNQHENGAMKPLRAAIAKAEGGE